jgi:hypothetical protein
LTARGGLPSTVAPGPGSFQNASRLKEAATTSRMSRLRPAEHCGIWGNPRWPVGSAKPARLRRVFPAHEPWRALEILRQDVKGGPSGPRDSIAVRSEFALAGVFTVLA